MSGRFVIVHRSFDPIQAEILGEILRDGGIAARVLGTRSAALVGAGQSAMQIHIEVPESQAGQATDFLESFFAGEGERLLEEAGILCDEEDEGAGAAEGAGGRDPDEGPGPQGEPLLRPLFAAASSLVLSFGLGYLYARRPFTAAILAAGQIAAWAALFSAATFSRFATAAAALAFLRLFELVGAQHACRAHNRGVRRAAAAQLAIGGMILGGVLAVSAAVAARMPEPAPELDRDDPAAPFPRELSPVYF